MADALLAAQEFQPELAVLDVMLPDGDGFALMEALQRQGREYPILFLTARGEDEDKFRGYGLGADDYIVKPFLPRELTYKITAILRAAAKRKIPHLSLRDSQIDFERGEVAKDGRRIPSPPKNTNCFGRSIIATRAKSSPLTRFAKPSGATIPLAENSLMAHVRRVREKIEKDLPIPSRY